MREAAQRRLMGLQDSRSKKGIMSRGKNIYKGASAAPNNQKGKQLTPHNVQQKQAAEQRKRRR